MKNDDAQDARAGDIEAARYVAARLAMFLKAVLKEKNIDSPVYRRLDSLLGHDCAQLILDRLYESGNDTPGKSKKSGMERFIKFLVPGKPHGSKALGRYLAWYVSQNPHITKRSLPDFQRLADELNAVISDLAEREKRAKANRRPFSYSGSEIFLPRRKVTKAQIERAWYTYRNT